MKNILLVEDEEDLVDIVSSVLREEGYTVKKSVTAEAYITKPFDIDEVLKTVGKLLPPM